jgi:hypothetical protein
VGTNDLEAVSKAVLASRIDVIFEPRRTENRGQPTQMAGCEQIVAHYKG